MNEIRIKGYIIGLNGTSISHVKDGKALHVSEIPYSIVNAVMIIGNQNEINI